jgi:hypothetical protein
MLACHFVRVSGAWGYVPNLSFTRTPTRHPAHTGVPSYGGGGERAGAREEQGARTPGRSRADAGGCTQHCHIPSPGCPGPSQVRGTWPGAVHTVMSTVPGDKDITRWLAADETPFCVCSLCVHSRQRQQRLTPRLWGPGLWHTGGCCSCWCSWQLRSRHWRPRRSPPQMRSACSSLRMALQVRPGCRPHRGVTYSPSTVTLQQLALMGTDAVFCCATAGDEDADLQAALQWLDSLDPQQRCASLAIDPAC